VSQLLLHTILKELSLYERIREQEKSIQWCSGRHFLLAFALMGTLFSLCQGIWPAARAEKRVKLEISIIHFTKSMWDMATPITMGPRLMTIFYLVTFLNNFLREE
jgi:hypothetical protein